MCSIDYTEALTTIKDGDIVFVHGSPNNNLVRTVIMYFTGSRFCHCFIVFRVTICGEEKVMCVEAQASKYTQAKRRVIPFLLYEDDVFTVVPAPTEWEKVKEAALRGVGVAKYSLVRAVYIGVSEYIRRRFGITIPNLPRLNEVCSDFCADVYGLEVNGSPQTLYDQLVRQRKSSSK